MLFRDLAFLISKLGFCASFTLNFFVIYLTWFYIERVFETYRIMIVAFASLGIIYSGLEVFIRPYLHVYNNCILYFSLSTWNSTKPLLPWLFAIWSGMYLVVVAFISIQFIYRFMNFFNTRNMRMFKGIRVIFWLAYPLVPGAIQVGALFIFCSPDEYSTVTLREVILETYDLMISDVVRFPIIPYDADGAWRFNNACFFLTCVLLIFGHYSIIIFCGLKMHLNMTQQLKKFSKTNGELQRQFFKALVFQCIGPTLFLILPIAPILLANIAHRFWKLEVNWKAGWIFSIIGLYPPFDSISFIIIISEYRSVIRDRYWDTFFRSSMRNKTRGSYTNSPIRLGIDSVIN